MSRSAGRHQKRGLIPRLPAGDGLLADAAVWLTGEYADAVRSTRTRTLPDGETAMAVDLHPAVPPLVLTAADSGRVTVSSETGVAGPGYHRFVGRVLERLGTELGIDWVEGDGATRLRRPGRRRTALSRLARPARSPDARARSAAGQRGVPLGIPAGTHVRVRRRRCHRARSARRSVARGGDRRPARRGRNHTLVG